ncbi:MAG TPA: glycoside hydrolase family 2 protein [Armatimonadota bacterium]|jgi:beta-mannosidase
MNPSEETTVLPLNTGWRFTEVRPPDSSPNTALPWMPATVPGHVHDDLARAGVIPDPFSRMQERGVGWVDETDWVYENTFTLETPPANAYLRFEGLDTIAEIELNGEPLANTDNMFVEHEFPVGGRLKAGENTLKVTFRSALRIGRERRAAYAKTGEDRLEDHRAVWGPRSFVRKAQYMYGWDWGPELVSCGIWKGVSLVSVPVARITDWKYDTVFNEDGSATVAFEVSVERAPGQEETPLTAAVSFPMHGIPRVLADVPAGLGRLAVPVKCYVSDAKRWVPNGSGNPERYRTLLELSTSGVALDVRHTSIGLRTVELVREPDADGKGECFKFRVNGKDVFIKGANWIPAHSLPSRLDSYDGFQHLERVLTQARDGGINMVRVWGGGVYESVYFYRLCDSFGILVWQDFPYACAHYPDTGEYAEEARAEAMKAVRRLRNHPSLALWCGNNENQWLAAHWPKSTPNARVLGSHLYDEVLPEVVKQEDASTPYCPSSPFGGDEPNSQDAGDRHDWDVWHGGGDYTKYLEDNSRFVSEFGFASSCGLKAWDSCLAPEDKHPYSDAVKWHNKTGKKYEEYIGYTAAHFPEPRTLEDLVYYTQLNQAEALKCGVEHWRRHKGRCWGTIFWQLEDCWPVQSWAVIDSAGEPKAAYYGMKRFYAPVLISLVRDGDVVRAHLTNDTNEPIRGKVTVRVESFIGERLEKEDAIAYIPANGTAEVDAVNIVCAEGREREVYVYARFRPEDGGPQIENYMFLAEPKELQMADPGLSVDVSVTGGGFVVTLGAKRFTPYIWLRLTGDEPGEWSDNHFHMRAGKETTVTLNAPGLSVEDVRSRLVVRHL